MASVAEAMRLIPPEPPTKALASVLGQQAAVLMHSGRTDDAAAAAEHALEVARRAESMADIGQALAMLGWTRVVRGDIDAGLAGIRQARDTAVMAGDASGIALGCALLAHMLAWVGRRAEARDAAMDGYDRVVELGLQRTYGATLLGYAVQAFIEEGSWQLAERWVERGLHPEPSGRPAHWLRINRARLLTLRGSFAEATNELLEADEHEASSGGTEYRDDLVAAHAELIAWRGGALEGAGLTVGDAVEPRRGRRAVPAGRDERGPGTVVELVLARPPSVPFGPAAAWTIVHALMAEADEAERARAVANHDRATAAIARAEALHGQLDAAMAVHSHLLVSPGWRSLVELAAIEAARAREQARPEDWERQADAWSEVGDPFRTAYADYRLGVLLLRLPSRRSDAIDRLDAAAATADALGATVLSDRIGLVRSPGRPATPAAEDEVSLERPDRLTVHALGRLQFLRDGVPVRSIGGPKAGRRQAEGLFAFLLDRGPKGITKDEAVEMIWPEQELAAGDLAFHRTLGGLRRTLEPDLESISASKIGFDHDRYSLDPRAVAWTDFGAFELAMEEARSTPDPFAKASALEEARRLYRGDYFDDCPYFGDSPEVEPTRRRLRADFVDLLVMLAELAEERGDARSAAVLYREALEHADEDLPIAAAGLSRIGQLGAQVRALGA
jgi:DNA-binding SARP family transcriptional activator